MRSTESQELFMIYLESHQQLSSGSDVMSFIKRFNVKVCLRIQILNAIKNNEL